MDGRGEGSGGMTRKKTRDRDSIRALVMETKSLNFSIGFRSLPDFEDPLPCPARHLGQDQPRACTRMSPGKAKYLRKSVPLLT